MRDLASIPDSEAVATVLRDQANESPGCQCAQCNRSFIVRRHGQDSREVRPALTYVTKTLLHLVMFEKLGLSLITILLTTPQTICAQ